MTHPVRSFGVARLLALAAALAAAPCAAPASAQAPVVHAVLFYSPTCPHCHEVINTHLPPLRGRYGDQFVIVGVDVTTPNGSGLYEAAVEHYGLAPDRLGVPLLVIGDVTLLGSLEIPEQLPGLIESGLATGGTDWPALPALRQALVAQGLIVETSAVPDAPPAAADDQAADSQAVAAQAPLDTARRNPEGPSGAASGTPATSEETASPGASATGPGTPDDAPAAAAGAPEAGADLTTSFDAGATARLTATQRFMQDPAANSIAVIALLILVGALILSVLGVRPSGPWMPVAPRWVIPALALLGLAIAGYLSRVEITGAHAVCGPVGDCNTVQQSEYARFLGVPVGILGALGYLGMLAAWFMAVAGPTGRRVHARVTLWAFALAGVAFSTYLTFLEPFVIGATCAWCVSSALIMAALLVLATGEVRRGA